MPRPSLAATSCSLAAAAWLLATGAPAEAEAEKTERVSVGPGGLQANAPSGELGVAASQDGRFVAFASHADNLVPGDTSNAVDVFVRDCLSLAAAGPGRR